MDCGMGSAVAGGKGLVRGHRKATEKPGRARETSRPARALYCKAHDKLG